MEYIVRLYSPFKWRDGTVGSKKTKSRRFRICNAKGEVPLTRVENIGNTKTIQNENNPPYIPSYSL